MEVPDFDAYRSPGIEEVIEEPGARSDRNQATLENPES
jgi:hypothetical protein